MSPEVRAAADAMAEALKTAMDYAADAANGQLWYESTKRGSPALVQLDKEQGEVDLGRFQSALNAYHKATGAA